MIFSIKRFFRDFNFRMFRWLLLAVAFYVISFLIPIPTLDVVFRKLGNATVAAHLGYFIDIKLFGRLDPAKSEPTRWICRAIIVGATMLTVGLGL